MSHSLMQSIQKAYRMDESECIHLLLKEMDLKEESIQHIQEKARILVLKLRETRLKKGGLDGFLSTYDLSSQEGVALLCMAEALLRIPDPKTVDLLIKDKMLGLAWEQHIGKSHSVFVNAATFALMLTGKLMSKQAVEAKTLMNTLKELVARMGEPVVRQAVLKGMKILGRQFVMAETITDALNRAHKKESKGYLYSYDMLGEAAKTKEDAKKYYEAYEKAIRVIGENAKNLGPILGPGISVKLSALHPRYEWVNRKRIMIELLPRLKALLMLAKHYNLGFTIDAEEADRLELSLTLIEALMNDPDLEGWQGLGLAVQAYQKRASFVIDWLINLAKQKKRRLMIRLVKGAYWDSEIKWTQEKGLKGYPVFTRKSSTDVCYLVCAKKLLNAINIIYPQFATHNAHTVAAVLEMATGKNQFEFQCLQGMGDSLYDHIVGKHNLNIPCRIYAPVGNYENLLPYLVRRLLENGANTSFVNRIVHEKAKIEDIIRDPILKTKQLLEIPHPKIPLPKDLYGSIRPNSVGIDINNPLEIEPVLQEIVQYSETIFERKIPIAGDKEIEETIQKADLAMRSWHRTDPVLRGKLLEQLAIILEKNRVELMALLVREGGKTILDANSEVREAVDFCWYYASQIYKNFQAQVLEGPTGEYNQLSLQARGILVCISPWNFPLAIFLGQITAALAAGNCVIAKPASQTPLIALRTIELLYEAGFPREVVQCLMGAGSMIGNKLVEDLRIRGVLFTGSTETARGINQKLANRKGPIIPFIAETGGQNAMIVDSTALSEQVISDVLVSSFNSAGQRCSALRVLFVQEEVADRILEMLKGAMAELKIGDPYELSTDVGPVIDKNALETLELHLEQMKKEAKLIYQCELPSTLPNLPRGVFFAPCAFEISNVHILKQEIFGPILHVIRYKSSDLDKVIEDINSMGYGLTLGIQSRINEKIDYLYHRLKVGNIYVNRNMIGAVVGVQPFGGEGLSGTGPKAGGPHMLQRLATEKTLSINTTAAGGNTTLMSLMED